MVLEVAKGANLVRPLATHHFLNLRFSSVKRIRHSSRMSITAVTSVIVAVRAVPATKEAGSASTGTAAAPFLPSSSSVCADALWRQDDVLRVLNKVQQRVGALDKVGLG